MPGIHVLQRSQEGKTWMAGTPRAKTRFALYPGHDGFETLQSANGAKPQAASAALAFSAIAWNAAGSLMARSDSTLRSTVMPDLDRPLINTL